MPCQSALEGHRRLVDAANAAISARMGGVPALPPAVQAFDALAPKFDECFRPWRSVAAQRVAVRNILLSTFPPESHLLELGGGTGEDALFLASAGRNVFLTDGAPEMVARAETKALAAGLSRRVGTAQLTLEGLEEFARERSARGEVFDGCYSNFASLNCIEDLTSVGRGLARLLPPGAHALLVVFGPSCPGEILVLALRGRWKSVFRRFSREPVPARVNGFNFTVRYPSPRQIAREMAPFFVLRRTFGIGVLVPPSSAEPEVSRFPHFISALSAMDRVLSRPLALLGDHVLLDLVRTDAPAEKP